MKFRKKAGILLCLFIFVTFGVMLVLVSAVKSAVIAERKAAAQTVETAFSKGIGETFGNINYATKLSYAIDLDDADNLDLFQKSVRELAEENDHIIYAAYFAEDTLDYIYPMERFGSLVGKDMADFAYSITLAKVVMEPIVEGPTALFDENENVFLFMQPLYAGTTYVGEIVVAMDEEYVLSTLGLETLKAGNYDYELWRVDFLGESKTIIATSDASVDFSDAAKQQFNLPATWSLSIIQKGGWITNGENIFIYSVFFALGVVIFGIGMLLHDIFRLKKQLEIEKYTNSSSGLFTTKGFFFFLNKRLLKNPDETLYVVHLQLENFRRFTKDMERDDITEHLVQMKNSIKDFFAEDAIAARVSDDSFLIAFSADNKNPDDLMEEFSLQLHWKRRLGDYKIFITPRYCMVAYPEQGSDAASLVKAADKQFEKEFEKKAEM